MKHAPLAALVALSLAGCGGSNVHTQSPLPSSHAASRGFTEMVIADQCDAGQNGGSILRFPPTATGNVAPTTLLTGPAVGGQSVAVDANDRAWVYDELAGDPPQLLAFPNTSGANPTAVANITGSATTLGGVTGLFINSTGYLYAADDNSRAIDVFAPGASGNVAPVERIAGASTGFVYLGDVAVDSSSNIWAADFGANTVFEFAAGANGNVAPIASIHLSAALGGLSNVAVDSHDNIWVSTNAPAAIYEFSKGVTGTASPTLTITGAATAMKSPAGLKVDTLGNVYVVDLNVPAVFVFANGASGNASPSQTIAGSSTGLFCPTGIALH